MKGTILAVTVLFGLAVLLGSAGSVSAGGNSPQDHWTWQAEEALGTGTLPPSDAPKSAVKTERPQDPGMTSDTPDFDSDPRWKESGGE